MTDATSDKVIWFYPYGLKKSTGKILKDIASRSRLKDAKKDKAATKFTFESKEVHQWANKKGKEISASVVSIDKGVVEFRLKSAKICGYNISNLSDVSRKKLKKFMRQSCEG